MSNLCVATNYVECFNKLSWIFEYIANDPEVLKKLCGL